MSDKPKMELHLDSFGSWSIPRESDTWYKNSVWMLLQKPSLDELKTRVSDGYPFSVICTFKSGAGKNDSVLELKEYKG